MAAAVVVDGDVDVEEARLALIGHPRWMDRHAIALRRRVDGHQIEVDIGDEAEVVGGVAALALVTSYKHAPIRGRGVVHHDEVGRDLRSVGHRLGLHLGDEVVMVGEIARLGGAEVVLVGEEAVVGAGGAQATVHMAVGARGIVA